MLATLLTLWLLFMAALMSPGANMLLVTQLAASGEARSARLAAIGVALGSALWCACAVLGIDGLFRAFPTLRLALQTVGGLYLLYLAIRLWRAPPLEAAGEASLTPLAAFRRGLLTNITNPKAALFFGSVFAAVLPSSPDAVLQVGAVAVIGTTSLVWHLTLAWLFSRPAVNRAFARASSTINRAAGALVGLLGLALLASTAREVGRKL